MIYFHSSFSLCVEFKRYCLSQNAVAVMFISTIFSGLYVLEINITYCILMITYVYFLTGI